MAAYTKKKTLHMKDIYIFHDRTTILTVSQTVKLLIRRLNI